MGGGGGVGTDVERQMIEWSYCCCPSSSSNVGSNRVPDSQSLEYDERWPEDLMFILGTERTLALIDLREREGSWAARSKDGC